MSTSVVLPLGCRPLPQTPKQIFLPGCHLSKETNLNDWCQNVDDVFKRELVFESSPSPRRRRPMIPLVVPSDGNPSQSACNFVWEERPRPMLTPVVSGEVTDSATALEFIMKTIDGPESPKSLCASPTNDCFPSPQMKIRQRQVSKGLLLEEDPNWDQKKIVPARHLWLRARSLLRQAGLNPRKVTMVYPSEAANAGGQLLPTRKQCSSNSDSLVIGALTQAPTTPKTAKVGGAVFPTALESGRECANQKSSSFLLPKDALDNLSDDHLNLKLKEKGTKKVRDGLPTKSITRRCSKDSLGPLKVCRTRLATIGADCLWARRPMTM